MTEHLGPHSRDTSPRAVGALASSLGLPPAKAIVAVLVGAAAGALVLIFPNTGSPAWVGVALAMALSWAAMIDLDRFRLPDLLTLPLIAGGLIQTAAIDATRLPDHLIGAAGGYLALVLVAEVYRTLRKRDGLGRGDAKLLAAAGAWLGWKALPFLVLASAVGALFLVVVLAASRGRTVLSRPLPFGPFLATAFLALWIVRPWPLG